MTSLIGPDTTVVLHDHREGDECNERCFEVPKAPAPVEPKEEQRD